MTTGTRTIRQIYRTFTNLKQAEKGGYNQGLMSVLGYTSAAKLWADNPTIVLTVADSLAVVEVKKD